MPVQLRTQTGADNNGRVKSRNNTRAPFRRNDPNRSAQGLANVSQGSMLSPKDFHPGLEELGLEWHPLISSHY